MGVLRKRVAPPYQTAEVRKSSEEAGLSSCYRSAGAGTGSQGSGDGESVMRARASNEGRERGDGQLPSASQSNHCPNLLFCSAGVQAEWPDNARRDPGKVALGSEIKIHQE
jgi:hypothetical protein